MTDLYQLTMAYGYWKVGLAEHRSVFHLFFRKNPFAGGYSIAAGLEQVTQLLKRWKFSKDDRDYLSGLNGNDGQPLFEPDFLTYLTDTPLQVSLDAIREGTVVFPHEPLLRVSGPLIQCQLLETALLTIINFQTLIATKASRICRAAKGDPVLEFGLRRAQGIDGGLSASRAAYIGGCAATSNVLAGKLYDIPVKGTHAHSWVMAFSDEPTAFRQYASALPNNCVFLVDTYDTLNGVKNAIEVGQDLRKNGHEMVGIRLDSGDLSQLSIRARKLLDEGGFPNASIIASNDLDEYRIQALKEQGAEIRVWGVGTRMATAYDQPALGGVYKLAAIKSPAQTWQYRIKLSEQTIKTSNPGIQQVRRYYDVNGKALCDLIYDDGNPPVDPAIMVSTADGKTVIDVPTTDNHAGFVDLLEPVLRDGHELGERQSAGIARDRCVDQLSSFPETVLSLSKSADYTVGLCDNLNVEKQRLISISREKR